MKKKIIKNVLPLFLKMGRLIVPRDSQLYQWLYEKLVKAPSPICNYIDTISAQRASFNFIQIGANDGKSTDPIREFILRDKWTGVFVEPVTYLFNSLVDNYSGKHEGLYFENVAVASNEKTKKFYYIDDFEPSEDKPFWLNQLGSFNREHVIGAVEKYGVTLVEQDVACKNIIDIVEAYELDVINLLHIDTEGYDYEIIKSLNLSKGKVRPEMIFFEHRHLSEDDKKECYHLLAENGYELMLERYDTLAYVP